MPAATDAAARSLGPVDVHVWYLRLDEVPLPGDLARWEAMLSAAERDRWQRVRLARHRLQHLAANALARQMLSGYAPVDPAAWLFRENSYGRPEIAAPGRIDLRFNLSHTNGLVTCAVARGRDVGVDVEDVRRRPVHPNLPRRYFAPPEAAALARLPEADRHLMFFDYWTLKEAYIKARGMGLAIPLRDFWFDLSRKRPSIAFAPDLHDDPAAWQFERSRPTERHCLALAVRRPPDRDCLVTLREIRASDV